MTERIWTWLDRTAAMTVKELKQLSRDPVLLGVLVYFFTADVYMAGVGVHMDLRNAPIAVMDHDRSATSRELIHRFLPPYFSLKGSVGSQREATGLLDRGEVLAILDIPADFGRDLLRGGSVSVQMQVDASNTVLGTLATADAAQIVGRFGAELAAKRLGVGSDETASFPRVLDRHRTLYNPNQTDSWFMSISELLTVITMLSLMLPAAAAVREKERGTIEQLAVSPLSPFQVLFPKVLAMGLAVLAGTAICLYFVVLPVFHMPIRGSLPLFFSVTALYVFATSGLGLFIASLSRNLAQVVMLVILLMMPLLLLSGSWTPPEAMPRGLRWAMHLSPLFHYIEMGYGILLKGAGASLLRVPLFALALQGGVIFGFGMWRFRRQLERV